MSDLMLDVGQASELKYAMRRANMTSEEVKRMCEGNFMSNVASLLRNECELTPITKALADLKNNVSEPVTYLKSLSAGRSIVIEATDGKRTIVQATNVFKYIDPDFKSLELDVNVAVTSKMSVEVFEQEKDGTFVSIFGSVGRDMNAMCLTQNQIIVFVQKHREWLRTEGYGTFFLFEVDGKFLVARVDVDSDGELSVNVDQFSCDRVWYARCCERFVLPQLTV